MPLQLGSLTVCPVSSAWRLGGPGIHTYTRMMRSVPPVTKNLPPGTRKEGGTSWRVSLYLLGRGEIILIAQSTHQPRPLTPSCHHLLTPSHPHTLTRAEGGAECLVSHPVLLHKLDCSSTANQTNQSQCSFTCAPTNHMQWITSPVTMGHMTCYYGSHDLLLWVTCPVTVGHMTRHMYA